MSKRIFGYQNRSRRSSLSFCSLITFLSSSVTASDVVAPSPLGDPGMLLETQLRMLQMLLLSQSSSSSTKNEIVQFIVFSDGQTK